MTSIRRFLITVLLGAIALINLGAAWYGYRSSVAEAEQLFDKRLADIAGVLAATPPGYYRTATGDTAIAFQIWEQETLQAASGNAPDQPITGFESGYSDIVISSFRWRAYALYLPDTERWVLVAESADIRSTLADSIVLDSVLPIILSLPVCGLLIWIIVGRGLRPLDVLAKEMRQKRSDDLQPVTNMKPSRELSVLVSSINDLLQRLDASFERERQFSADAAHELRTPISVLKLRLHNLLRDTREPSPQLESLQSAVDRMERSVEQVLLLYRLAPDQFAARFAPTDLSALARETIAELYPQLESRGQEIELLGTSPPISGDAFALQIMLLNLIENASRYSGEAGSIRVSLSAEATGTTLVVEDSGPGIPEEYREQVFERFYRGEHDGAAEGSGIGLAIVKNIAEIHGAQIRLDDSGFATGLAVSVIFPDTRDARA